MRSISIAAALVVAVAQYAHAQDGMAELKKVQQTYLGLKSYSQKTSSTMTRKINGRSDVQGQTAELRYQQPDRVFVNLSSPKTGTFVSYNAGGQMLVYAGAAKRFARRPAQPSVKDYVKALKQFGIGTMLDPLAFLTGEPIQTAIASATVKGVDTIDGAKCDVLAAKLAPAFASKTKSATATFWVDKELYVLRKVEIAILGVHGTARQTVMEKGKRVVKQAPVLVDSNFLISVQDIKLNPPLTDSAFTFELPKDATDVTAKLK